MPPGPKARRIINEDAMCITHAIAKYLPALVVSDAKGSILRDVDGNTYIDFVAGISVLNIGHCHPKVVKAIKKQAEKLLHVCSVIGVFEENVRLADQIKEIAPGELKDGMVFFSNSGSEAVEGCLKLAKYFSHKPVFIAYHGAFHGRTLASLALTASKARYKKYLAPLFSDVVHVPYPYCYRCFFEQEHPDCDLLCLRQLEWLFKTVVPPENVVAMIVEPIQGDGGYIVPPTGYFSELRKTLKKYDILLIDDEIQSGFGRTGKMFAIEHWKVSPDIMALGKAIGGGLPLGAILAKKELMDVWEPGAHSSTMGGNPVACAAGLTTIKAVLEGNLTERTREMGDYIMKRLTDMTKKRTLIGDVRGMGLMIGVELVKDRSSKEPAIKETSKVIRESLKRGLVIIPGGVLLNVLRIIPPLNIEKEHVDKGLDILDEVLKEVESMI